MAHRNIRGTIVNNSDNPERCGQERRRDYFTSTRQADGASGYMQSCYEQIELSRL